MNTGWKQPVFFYAQLQNLWYNITIYEQFSLKYGNGEYEMEKGQILELTIEDMSQEGNGIGKAEGFAVNIKTKAYHTNLFVSRNGFFFRDAEDVHWIKIHFAIRNR